MHEVSIIVLVDHIYLPQLLPDTMSNKRQWGVVVDIARVKQDKINDVENDTQRTGTDQYWPEYNSWRCLNASTLVGLINGAHCGGRGDRVSRDIRTTSADKWLLLLHSDEKKLSQPVQHVTGEMFNTEAFSV